MAIWAGFILGLLGSLHCVGMCGPLAMALPLSSKEKLQVIFQSLIYNLGRISTYALMGLFMGLMGWGIALAGYQKLFSILLGAALIISAIFSFSLEQRLLRNAWFHRAINLLKSKLSQLLSINSRSSAFRIGLLNGLLPCGLVYIALAGAIAYGNTLSGAIHMAAFGFGTLPLMFGVMVFGNLYKSSFSGFRKWIPAGLVVFGLFLIYRGMMLDVPADLQFWESNNFPIMCH